jgi:hypothetical protein
MRTAIAALATIGLAATLAACGPTSTVKTGADTPNSPATTTAAGTKTAAKPATTKPKPKPAGIGDTITVKEFMTPGSGKRYVAAQIRVTNVGTAVYDDTPSNGMQVADGDGQRFESTFADVSAGPSMPSEVKLPHGDKALGYVAFEVPKASKITTLQFTADSGFADEAAQWKVR